MIKCKVCNFIFDITKTNKCPRCNTPLCEIVKCDLNCSKCHSNCMLDNNKNKSIK